MLAFAAKLMLFTVQIAIHFNQTLPFFFCFFVYNGEYDFHWMQNEKFLRFVQ